MIVPNVSAAAPLCVWSPRTLTSRLVIACNYRRHHWGDHSVFLSSDHLSSGWHIVMPFPLSQLRSVSLSCQMGWHLREEETGREKRGGGGSNSAVCQVYFKNVFIKRHILLQKAKLKTGNKLSVVPRLLTSLPVTALSGQFLRVTLFHTTSSDEKSRL